jgi:Tfp pilus assembly protein FimT
MELMIVVAVLAVITSLALPSYRSIIEKRQVTSGAQQLSAFLSTAQMEAVKRNRNVAVSCSLESGTCETVALGIDAEPDTSLQIVSFCQVANDDSCTANIKADVDAISYGGSDAQVVFDPVRGMMVQDDIVGQPLQIQLSSTGDLYAMNVRLSATGWVTMCSDDPARGEKHVPGFPSC